MKSRNRNQGFSLLELIIVIAIMAVMLGVLAPQYIKYVEKSRVAKDDDLADVLLTNACLMAVSEDYVQELSDGDRIILTYSGITITASTSVVEDAMDEFTPDWRMQKTTSKKYHSQQYVVKFQGASGANTFDVKGSWTP